MSLLEQYRVLHDRAGLVDRSQRGRLRLTGTDRRDYLQGLLTNEIAALAAGTGCYAALLTPQGRMISDMSVAETGDAIVMDLEREVTDTVLAHLDKFIIMEDVRVADESGALAQVGVYGSDAARVVSDALTADRGELGGLRVFENRILQWNSAPVLAMRRDDIGVTGFDLLVAADLREALIAAVRSAGAADIDPEVVEVSRVEAGRPMFGRDMTEDTIPLEAGIEDRAISLTKGCYVGQEIIIRVLHRGHGRVARRLVGLTLDTAAATPAPGDRVKVGEREVGAITSAVRSLALERPIALAYVQRDFTSPGTDVAVVSETTNSTATVVSLPFTTQASPFSST